MKRITFILGFLLIGCLGVMAQRNIETMNADECASYGRKLFDMELYEDAWPYVKKAAEGGWSLDAHLMAGWMFHNGKGVKQDYKVAMREFNKGAMKGSSTCLNNMGIMYENGQGVKKNHKIAFNLYKKAADKRETYGRYNVGRCYENGIGVEVDYDTAESYYRKISQMLFCGEDVKKLCNEGLARIREKRYSNNEEATHNNTAEEKKQEKEVYVEYVVQDDVEDVSIYHCEKYGKELYEMEMYREALPYIRKAAEQSNADGNIRYMAGQFYELGLGGVTINYGIALREYKSGAEKGHKGCYLRLGGMYEEGKGCDANPKEAFLCYFNSSTYSHDDIAVSYREVGRCYHCGIGVEINLDKAIEFYDKAIRASNDSSFKNEVEGLKQRVAGEQQK